MRILSWILSLLLHACVALAGVYLATPGEMRVSLDVPVYQVELVHLKPKKGRPAAVRKAPEAKPAAKPAPRPAAKPVAAKPEPKPKAKAIAAKVAKPKKPKAQDIPKKAAPRKSAKPKKPEKSRKQLLAEALAHAQKDVKWLERKEARERKKALDEALAQAEADAALAEAAEEAEIGAGGEDEDGAMLGLRDIYAAQVKKIIKENWRFPSIPVDRSLVAGVFIRVGPNGHITDYNLLARSGRPDFDESVLKAVEETEQLPPPPGDISEIRINFNLQDMR